MKLIIIEGGDRLGKSTLIEGICKKLNYDNITIRHFGKPPRELKGDAAFGFQMTCFQKEAELVYHMLNFNEDYEMGVSDFFKYEYANIMIWNRSHLGEYVYGQMFRGGNPEFMKQKLIDFETVWLNDDKLDIYLITLTADPNFFLMQEDGQSFSQNIDQKTTELGLFKQAHEFSTIQNKLLVKVDNETEFQTGTEWRMKGPNIFRPKEEILSEVINFIK